MLDVQSLGVYAGALMTIIGLVGLIIRPIIKMMDNMTKMGHTLDMLNNDLQVSKSDRGVINHKGGLTC